MPKGGLGKQRRGPVGRSDSAGVPDGRGRSGGPMEKNGRAHLGTSINQKKRPFKLGFETPEGFIHQNKA